MSKYLDRLKQLETEKNSLYSHRPEVPKPPKAPFVSFVSTPRHINVKNISNNEKERELDLLVDFVAMSNNFMPALCQKRTFSIQIFTLKILSSKPYLSLLLAF